MVALMREFNPQELQHIQNLVGYAIDAPLRYNEQKSILNEQGRCVWCEDWFHIEVLKYMINRDMYLRDNPPNRLRYTKFSRQKMSELVEAKILEIESTKKDSSFLYIGNPGRGELLLWMVFCKKWDRIVLNEPNPLYVKFLDFICKVRYDLKVEFYEEGMDLTDFVTIKGFEADICPQEN